MIQMFGVPFIERNRGEFKKDQQEIRPNSSSNFSLSEDDNNMARHEQTMRQTNSLSKSEIFCSNSNSAICKKGKHAATTSQNSYDSIRERKCCIS
jgi:hypothetical protein